MFKSLIAVFLFVVLANGNEIRKLSDFIVKDLDGKDISFKRAEGNCVLIINTGSGCGLTNANMKWLNNISQRYPELMVIAFPSNSFNQEKKSNEELKNWFFNEWQAKYNVLGKVNVKQNEETSDIYKFLIEQSGGKAPLWNYTKYIVEKDGTVERYGPQAGALFFSSIIDLISGQSIESHIRKCLRK